MDLSRALTADLAQLTVALDSGARDRVDLTRSLRSLGNEAATVVTSFVGLSVTLLVDGEEVTLTSLSEPVERSDIQSWLQLPVEAITPGSSGSVLLYATRRDAFVELARELRAMVQVPEDVVTGSRPAGRLPSVSLVSGITGAEEMSSINRAIGLLLGQGYTPEDARAHLDELALLDEAPVAEVAGRLLQRSDRPLSGSPEVPRSEAPGSEVPE